MCVSKREEVAAEVEAEGGGGGGGAKRVGATERDPFGYLE